MGIDHEMAKLKLSIYIPPLTRLVLYFIPLLFNEAITIMTRHTISCRMTPDFLGVVIANAELCAWLILNVANICLECHNITYISIGLVVFSMWSGLHHVIVRPCVPLLFVEIANYCTLWRQWPVRVHMSHSPYYCSQTLHLCTCEVKLSYNQTDTIVIYTMHLSLQVECWGAHILTARKGQGSDRLRKRIPKNWKEVEIIPGRPWSANWHL